MKYLITGIGGFVGTHLCRYLIGNGHTVYGLETRAPKNTPDDAAFPAVIKRMSLLDAPALGAFLKEVRPDRIVHLASASSVALSWERPAECFVNNTNIFLNLLEEVRKARLACRILSVGSSEEYGIIADRQELPVREDHALAPMSPYAVARVAQEHLSQVYVRGYGLDIICTRSFNHIGPGQSERFVVSSFVKQAVEVFLKMRGDIAVGRLEIVRDFIDVRDVIKAYDLLLDKGCAGEVYNVCGGNGFVLKDILGRTCTALNITPEIQEQKMLMRPIDNSIMVGDSGKLMALGFQPQYELAGSLNDMIAWWKQRLEMTATVKS